MTCSDCQAEVTSLGLAYLTFDEATCQIGDTMIKAEADLAQAIGWRDERSGRLHVVRRRYAYARALRVALARASRAVDARALYGHAAELVVEFGLGYAQALARMRTGHRALPEPAEVIEW